MLPPPTPRTWRDGTTTHTLGGIDNEIFDDMGKLAVALELVAEKMKRFSTMCERTRSLITKLRMTAIEVKTEVETRRGW